MYSRREFMQTLTMAGASLLYPTAWSQLQNQNPTTQNHDASMALAEAWLSRQKSSLTPTDCQLLNRAQSTLLHNILWTPDPKAAHVFGAAQNASQTQPWAPLRGISPSPSGYRGIWNWDSAFHALAVSHWDATLAREQIKIILDRQLPHGGLPDVIFENGNVVTNFGKPPVLGWSCAIIDRRAPDDKFLEWAYPRFVRNEAHWRNDRGGEADGLFHYGSENPSIEKRDGDAKLESGWDNSPRWDHGCASLWPVDLNCFMVMLYESLEYMAERLKMPDSAKEWGARRATLAAKINVRLWNADTACYQDFDFKAQRFSPVLSPACFMPLYTKIASETQASSMAVIAANARKFFPGCPSVSYDDPQFHSPSYWRGPVWLNIAFFQLKGLSNYGHHQVSDTCRTTILQWCTRNQDAFREYYDSKSGKGLGAKNFGWTAAFVIELILSWKSQSEI